MLIKNLMGLTFRSNEKISPRSAQAKRSQRAKRAERSGEIFSFERKVSFRSNCRLILTDSRQGLYTYA